MVDVSQKADTERVAVAGFIAMHPETLALIVEARRRKATCWRAHALPVMAAKRRARSFPCATRSTSRGG
ncbi:MAG: cyclic pyranopterin monophosphate synthase MoaC [Eggerthella lenta]